MLTSNASKLLASRAARLSLGTIPALRQIDAMVERGNRSRAAEIARNVRRQIPAMSRVA